MQYNFQHRHLGAAKRKTQLDFKDFVMGEYVFLRIDVTG